MAEVRLVVLVYSLERLNQHDNIIAITYYDTKDSKHHVHRYNV